MDVPSVLPRRRVLLIDDEASAAHALAEVLRDRGYEVRVACMGSDGLRQAQSFAPSVILVDLGLPDVNGLELAAGLRAHREPPPRLIALTVRVRGAAEAARQVGFSACLFKPLRVELVLAEIER